MTTRSDTITKIYKLSSYGEIEIGAIEDSQIYTIEGHSKKACGYVTDDGHIVRVTANSEQELGHVTANGQIISNGLFDGGALGWVEEDGVVVQAGLIMGEEDVGRVEGPQSNAAAAALLLHFLPLQAEEEKRMQRRY